MVITLYHLFKCSESFGNSLLSPIRLKEPTLFPSTAPVDMLMMNKGLIIDGYRFQNTMFEPQPNDSDLIQNHNYWENHRDNLSSRFTKS